MYAGAGDGGEAGGSGGVLRERPAYGAPSRERAAGPHRRAGGDGSAHSGGGHPRRRRLGRAFHGEDAGSAKVVSLDVYGELYTGAVAAAVHRPKCLRVFKAVKRVLREMH